MQQGRGKVFKIVIISMMVVMFLSTGLYSLMYIGGNPEQAVEDTGAVLEETGVLDMVDTGDVLTGALELAGN